MLQTLLDESFKKAAVSVDILRLDKIHPHITGNKWYKLKHNLEAFKSSGHHHLLTFGGAYSNHIHATAYAGAYFGIKTIGIIRGEETFPLNPVLTFAKAKGMDLHYMDRTTYRQKSSPEVIQSLHDQFGEFFLVPEGGTNALAIQGTSEILQELPPDYHFDTVCMAVGTGGTIAGVIKSLATQQKAIGFPVLKGGSFLHEDIDALIGKEYQEKYELMLEYHFGGYAKRPANLRAFVADYMEKYAIDIEPIYTGKMIYGVLDLIQKGYFPKGHKVLMLHTGGVH